MENSNYIQKRLRGIRSVPEDYLLEVPPFPKVVYMELTAACNHKCIFCGNSSKLTQTRSLDFSFAIDLLKQAYECGTRELGLYRRGETLLYNRLDELIREAKNIGYEYIFITTNGSMASPEKCKSLIVAGLSSIKFSFNAGSVSTYHKIHGKDDFEKVLGNIKFCREYRDASGIDFRILGTCVICKQNEHEVDTVTELFEQYMDDYQFYSATTQYGNMLDNTDLQVEMKHDNQIDMSINYPCPYPFTRFDITQEGYYSLCCIDYHNFLAVADLRITSVKDAWSCELARTMRKRHLAGCTKGRLCHRCISGSKDPIKPLQSLFADVIKEENN